MQKRSVLRAAGAAGMAACVALIGGPRPAARAAAPGARRPVLVELFTSEGCSDCPPADALATRLKRTQPVPGTQIIVLGQHVDYWNSRRWSDRFSQHAFSRRQEDYVQHLHLESPYTPQVVVDGHIDALGNDPAAVEGAVAEAARDAKADIQLTRAGVDLRIQVDHVPTAEASGSDVILAVTEDGLHSHVGGGENAGRDLGHSAVVRSLRTIATFRASPSGIFETTVPIPLAPDRKRGNLQAVVFVQARASRRVLGAAALNL